MAKPSRIGTAALSLMVLCLLASVVAPAIGAEYLYLPEKQNIVIFPIKNSIGEDKARMCDDLVVVLKEGLSLTDKFMVISYDADRNVSVQRAVAEQKIKAGDLKTAFTTDAQGVSRAQKICQAIATDLGVIGSLDSYSFDEAKKEAKIGLTLQVLKGASDSQPVTIAVTGIAAGKLDDQSQTEGGIAIAALDDAADKALSKLIDAAKIGVPVGSVSQDSQVYGPVEKPKSHRKGLLPAMLGALLLGLALSSN